ncbi:excalibur calcium-binding domain-containing protein [Ketogulonicigenium robustum]|uniref:excalibur calcium-binding domain-containing protein n=1 Tax=Ketogulonicigenium robustum TaxID=92947 RepID=UPI000A26E30C
MSKLRIALVSLVGALALSACNTPKALQSRYDTMSTASLWIEHGSTLTEPLALAFVEAELGMRGETSNRSDYIGRRTASAYRQSLYTRSASPVYDRNCSDFPSAAAAQQFFLRSGGPVSDPHGLDRDGDGFACEWGRSVSQWANAGRTRVAREMAAISRPRVTASRTCYTGPRGGRYTITSSGNRNYGGC